MAAISDNKAHLGVDTSDGVGCVSVWLQVWLTPCEGFVLTLVCPPRYDRSRRGGQVDMTL